jgi:hypothetical protein
LWSRQKLKSNYKIIIRSGERGKVTRSNQPSYIAEQAETEIKLEIRSVCRQRMWSSEIESAQFYCCVDRN